MKIVEVNIDSSNTSGNDVSKISTSAFELASEVGLPTYEATADLETEKVTIEG
ncbi:hypothetical protein ACLBOM_12215 [Escherichia coli]